MKPLPAEYLQKPTRPKPLVVEAYAGDITVVDTRILQETPSVYCLIAIELVEHLFPETLQGFEISVFEIIKPEIVIVSQLCQNFNFIVVL